MQCPECKSKFYHSQSDYFYCPECGCTCSLDIGEPGGDRSVTRDILALKNPEIDAIG